MKCQRKGGTNVFFLFPSIRWETPSCLISRVSSFPRSRTRLCVTRSVNGKHAGQSSDQMTIQAFAVLNLSNIRETDSYFVTKKQNCRTLSKDSEILLLHVLHVTHTVEFWSSVTES